MIRQPKPSEGPDIPPTPERFQILGVPLAFSSDSLELMKEAFDEVCSFFPFGVESVSDGAQPFRFLFESGQGQFLLTSDFGKQTLDVDKGRFLKHLRSLVRVTVASNAPGLLFLHAGVVEWKGKGIVIPGNSHSGKTSLVRELVSCGAVYYSDEYAVVDTSGRLLPFAKPLSVRGIDGPETQTDIDPASIGVIGVTPTVGALVLFTAYKEEARWNPVPVPAGEGILKLVPHAIGFANRPEFSLHILRKTFEKSGFWTSERPDSKVFARSFLETLDI